jgi:hypothetical protein
MIGKPMKPCSTNSILTDPNPLTIGSGHSSDDLASEGEISDDDNLSPQNSAQATKNGSLIIHTQHC